MGQKTNPRIFQLSKTSNWQSKCFEKKITEYSKYSKKDLEIRSFIEKFFTSRNTTVHLCKICYFEKSLHIFVSYHLNPRLPSLLYGSLSSLDRLKIKKKWKEPCKTPKLSSFKCRLVKSYIKQMSSKTKRPIKIFQFVRCNRLNRMIKFIRTLESSRLNHLKEGVKKGLKALSTIIGIYKRIKADLILNPKHLKKPVKLLKELVRTLYNKKLRNKEEKEKKRTGALKDILTEKMADSLQYFTSNNIALWVHLKALNLNRSKKTRKNIKSILKKNLIKLRKYKREKFYREGLEILLLCSTIRKPSALLAQFLAVQLKTLKKHNFFFKFIKDALELFNTSTLSKIKRIKIKIKGRLNARPKAKSRILKIGKDVSVVRIRSIIDYSEKTAFTSNGTLGIKVWVHEFSN